MSSAKYKDLNKEVKDIKYPAFVAGAIMASGKTEKYNHVTVNTKSTVTEEATDAKKLPPPSQEDFLGSMRRKYVNLYRLYMGDTASLDDERDTDNRRIGGRAAEVMG